MSRNSDILFKKIPRVSDIPTFVQNNRKVCLVLFEHLAEQVKASLQNNLNVNQQKSKKKLTCIDTTKYTFIASTKVLKFNEIYKSLKDFKGRKRKE